MNPTLVKAVMLVTGALLFYSIAVITEQKKQSHFKILSDFSSWWPSSRPRKIIKEHHLMILSYIAGHLGASRFTLLAGNTPQLVMSPYGCEF
jgi:hypothetical protein